MCRDWGGKKSCHTCPQKAHTLVIFYSWVLGWTIWCCHFCRPKIVDYWQFHMKKFNVTYKVFGPIQSGRNERSLSDGVISRWERGEKREMTAFLWLICLFPLWSIWKFIACESRLYKYFICALSRRNVKIRGIRNKEDIVVKPLKIWACEEGTVWYWNISSWSTYYLQWGVGCSTSENWRIFIWWNAQSPWNYF